MAGRPCRRVPGGTGQPVFLYVDDDVLTDLAGEQGAKDLGLTVRNALGPTGDVYRPIHLRAAKTWRRTDDAPPPTLPLLAVTVLAATRMERGSGTSANAYYKRLWEVVGVPASDPLAEHMRRDFDTAAILWQQFDEWLSAGGHEFGVSTIRLVDAHRTRIGYPLSQALVRKTDRNVLTRLWAVLGREVAAELSGDELVEHLQRWMRTDRGFSRQFVETVEQLNHKTRRDFAEALQEAAQRWDGVVRTKSGKHMHEARLAVQPTLSGQWKPVWIVNAPDSAAAVVLKGDDLIYRPVVYSSAGEEWTGISDGVAVLRWDSLQGCWLAVDRMLAGVPHALIWHRVKASAVREFVARSLGSGTLRPQSLARDVSFIENVRFASDAEIAEALKVAELTGIRLAGSTSPRLSIDDGLRVTNPLQKAIFIHGGEPDLAIPPGSGSGLTVRLDNSTSTTFMRGVLVPLRAMSAEIRPGHHVLESEEGSVQFETISPGKVVITPGPRDEVSVIPEMSGAVTTGDNDYFGKLLVFAKRHRAETWLVGPAAQIRHVAEPLPPPYWKRVLPEAITPLHFLISRRKFEGWLIQRKDDSYFVDEVVALPPDLPPDPDAVIDEELWLRLLESSAHACETQGWRNLLKAAGVQV